MIPPGPVLEILADGSPTVGLGHLSRSGAVAMALTGKGFSVRCHALGAAEPQRRDGVTWQPCADPAAMLAAGRADALVLDSYETQPEALPADDDRPMVAFRDDGRVPARAALVVDVGAADEHGPRRLGGLGYASLRPVFWGLPRRHPEPEARRVLVATGAGDPGGASARIVRVVREALPAAEISVVRGPQTTSAAPSGVRLLSAPQSLLDPLLAADLVVCSAGQTMLEAVATGAACIALPVAGNQGRQARQLAERGAVMVADPDDDWGLARAITGVAGSSERLRALAEAGQRAVDGFGAMRVAFALERLLRFA